MRDISNGKVSYSDILLFIVFPLIISIILSVKNIGIKPQISNIITALSILAGFLFNLLAIIYTVLDKIKTELSKKEELNIDEEVRLSFAKEIHTNISYNITIALFAIVILTINNFNVTFEMNLCKIDFFYLYNLSVETISYFLIMHFTLTLFMVLNRIYILLSKE
ncbi:hypothetical protein [Myroides odoratimimus]|uniref:hypothetical protein n=1 Tax=Myroides odoratimimus TaxID=76832 RepID=UPI00310134CE